MVHKRKGRRLTDTERVLWIETMFSVQPVRRPQNRVQDSAKQDNNFWIKWGDDCSRLPVSSQTEKFATPKTRQPAPKQLFPPNQLNKETNMPRLEVGKSIGIDRRTADRLRRGRIRIDMKLDLHGMTVEVARQRLLVFLNNATASGARCVLVITGKGLHSNSNTPDSHVEYGFTGSGAGRLKEAVPLWFNEPEFRPLLLSITPARPKDGGTGALYILLRKPARDKI
ncbi:MAG: Smr/MutS family protein [Rhodospirillaceae bacterium]